MRKTNRGFGRNVLVLCGAMVLSASVCWAADTEGNLSDIAKRIDASAKVLDEVMSHPDHAVPDQVMKRAQCVAVFPSMVEVAALVGGKYGKGFVSCRISTGWSAPAPLTVTGGNWGAQFGGEAVDLVMIVMNDKGVQQLESGKFNLGVETSAVAGPVGNHHWTMNSQMVTYARSKGVFVGTNLDGSSIAQDTDDTRALYGQPLSLSDILGGKAKDPNVGQTFVSKVAAYAGEKKARPALP
jgi:SH3 domain-containing YSC84-like protein 1